MRAIEPADSEEVDIERTEEGGGDKRAPESMPHSPHSDDDHTNSYAVDPIDDIIAKEHSASSNYTDEDSPKDDTIAEEHSNIIYKEDSSSSVYASSNEEKSSTALKEPQDDNR